MQCLSACGPCAVLCERCIESYERYVRETRERAISEAIRLLTAHGYTVTKQAAVAELADAQA